MRQLRVIYDGNCPFCSRYVALVRLKKNFAVELVDAREQPARAAAYGLDLNRGMIADLEGDIYHGADAVWLLSQMSSRSGLLNWLLAAMFSRRWLARLAYPVLRLGRNLTLTVLRRRPI